MCKLVRIVMMLVAWMPLAAVHALPTDLKIAQLHHTAWTLADGAPPDAWAIAQTADGALWLGTPTGLFRFDGVRFERFHVAGTPLASDVASLLATNDGGLWIGMRFGDIHMLRERRVTTYSRASGLPGRTVFRIEIDRTGTVWAATVGGLYRLERDHWVRVGAEAGLASDYLTDLVIARDGALWCVGPPGAFVRPAGSSTFHKVPTEVSFGHLVESPEGSVWFSGGPSLIELERPGQRKDSTTRGLDTSALEVDGSGDLLSDRDGGLWFVLQDIGRVARPSELPPISVGESAGEKVERFGLAQGLSGNAVRTFFEDDAGNIWVATNGGLDRFRVPKLIALDRAYTADVTWAQSPRGPLWMAQRQLGVSSSATPTPEAWHPPGISETSALHADDDGTLWIGTDQGLFVREGKQFRSWPMPTAAPDGLVHAITRDSAGTLWMVIVRKGLFAYQDNQWVANGGLQGLPDEVPLSLVADDRGLWLGYSSNQLAMVAKGRVKIISVDDGLNAGATQALLPRDDEVWVGGSEGVALIRDDTVLPLRGTDGQRFEGVSGIVMSNDGALWLNGAAGISRIAAEELQAVRVDASHAVGYELFDHNDGVRGVATQLRPLPSAFKERSGRLWFSTSREAYWIDPGNITRNRKPPTVELRGVKDRGSQYEPSERLLLPVGTDRLDIDYTALSLSIPEKVRFKYRLEGVDADWQHAGTRRTAFYTNLGHGEYRFTVTAANEDGVWHPTGASMTLVVPPAFYQSHWFLVLCGVAVVAIGWQLYAYRLRAASRRIRVRFEGKLQERERIARELHDTLLQSTQGLILGLHTLARKLPSGDATHTIQQMLDRAEATLAEGRDRVHELRAPNSLTNDLPHALALVTEELQDMRSIPVRHQLGGNLQPLRRATREQVYTIGREALINAFKHSQATQIDVMLDFEPHQLRLCVQDNGIGADTQALASRIGGKHWGVQGMRERARSLGVELRVSQASPSGVVVELVVPAHIAYVARARQLPWTRLIRRLRDDRV